MVYRYDLDGLEETRNGLNHIKISFENASKRAEDRQDSLGYSSLRGAMQEFVDNWDHERGKQLEAITAAHDSLRAICENYVTFDQGAATTLLEG